jgi:ribosomal protein S18 acetylase RimI-like enzyme
MVTNIGYHIEMTRDIETRIIATLRAGGSEGKQVEEIAAKLGLTRHTVAKYLEVLLAKDQVTFRKAGRTKLWKEASAQITVRSLAIDDIPNILRIESKIEKEMGIEESEQMKYLKETANYNIAQGDPLMSLGAEVDGKLVGFIIGEIKLWEFGKGEKTGWIKALGVDPQFQGKGVGKALGERLLDHFKRRGIKRVRTLVEWYAGDLISYFKSLGFDILNMIPLEKKL